LIAGSGDKNVMLLVEVSKWLGREGVCEESVKKSPVSLLIFNS
jgi:hypothetical protein